MDGAYNVRYEVIKKRIDKAKIRGGSERVTQPGKMAIVYSHRTRRSSTGSTSSTSSDLGYVTGESEELDLEELQGVQGLRALRATIDVSGVGPEPRAVVRAAAAGVRVLSR